jgi:phage gpG-like protein
VITIAVHAESLREIPRIISRVRRIAESRSMLDSIAALVQRQTARRILVSKQDPDGRAWLPWSPSYAATRGPQHSLLIDTSALVTSFAREVRSHDATVSTSIPYASAVQAARPFMGFGSAAISEVENHVLDTIASKLSSAARAA